MASTSVPAGEDIGQGQILIDPNDLIFQYNALLTEYNKVLESNESMKTELVQEQETKFKLAEALKQKEIRTAALEEENQSLVFNNNRLKKRLVVVQNELEEAQNKPTTGWFNWVGKEEMQKAEEKFKLLSEELERANKTNVELHQNEIALKEEQKQRLDILTKKMSKLKEELESKEVILADMNTYNKKIVDDLSSERDTAFVQVKDLQDKLLFSQKQVEERDKQIADLQEKHILEMKKARDIILRQVTFDDTKYPRLNTLNLPMFDRSLQTKLRDAITVGSGVLNELTISLVAESDLEKQKIDLIKKLNRGTTIIDAQLLSAYEKVVENLNSFNDFLSPLKNSFELIVKEFRSTTASTSKDNDEGTTNISDISKTTLISNFSLFTTYHLQLTSSRQTVLAEESKQRDCVRSVQQLNSKLQALESDYQAAIERVLVLVTVLCDNEVKPSKKDYVILLQRIQQTLQFMTSTKKEITTTLTQKYEKEHSDPFINPKKKSIDLKILAAAESTSLLLERIVETVNGYYLVLSNPPPKPIRGAFLPPNSGLLFNDHEKLHQRGNRLMKLINSDFIDNNGLFEKVLPFDVQLKKIEELNNLNVEVLTLHENLKKSNQENEQLEEEKKKLLHDLAASKDVIAEKKSHISQLLAELADARNKAKQVNPIQSAGGVTATVLPSPSTAAEQVAQGSSSKKWSLTVLDESGNQSSSLQMTEQDIERESKLRQFYIEKYAQLEAQLQTTDAKVIDLFNRKEKLENLLQQTQEQRDSLLKQLNQLQDTVSTTNDSLESTRSNYEMQLRVVSDHVVELSEKMKNYVEEINTIKAFKVRCGKCKTWNTLEWLMEEGKNGRYCSKGNHPSSLNFA